MIELRIDCNQFVLFVTFELLLRDAQRDLCLSANKPPVIRTTNRKRFLGGTRRFTCKAQFN